MKTARRCAVATFPKLWPPYATPRLACFGGQAIRTLQQHAVGWLPSRYRRWRSSGLKWKTKWPWKDVYNGDIGQVAQVDVEEGEVTIDFEGRLVTCDVGELDEVALAYAATIHKSQGSEYPVVVIPLATQHYPMLARNLLYTGVTRGKQLVVVIGQPRALAIAVRNVRATQRLTNLAAGLREGKGRHWEEGGVVVRGCDI